MKHGLVLEGGAMRGLFTAGVLDVMMENDIAFDAAVGVSAGAVFGCNFKSRQIGRTLRYNKKYCKDPRYCSIHSFLRTGDLFGADFCYNEIPYKLDPFDIEAYRANPLIFYSVCTDTKTGKPVYHRCDLGDGEDMDWFRASASMPVASKPVRINDSAYLDGGISDSIPLRFLEGLGYEKNVVLLTQPEGYVKPPLSHAGFIKLAMRKEPKAYEALLQRSQMYNETLAYIRQRQQEGEIFLIQPRQDLGIGHICHDPDELERVYQIGRSEGERILPSLAAFLRT